MNMPAFVDTHVHFWDLQQLSYPWLIGADAELRQSYLPLDLLIDTAGLEVMGVVHVQAEVSHSVDPVAETLWLEHVRTKLPSDFPPMSYVGYADLRSDGLEDLLDRHLAAGPVTGIRQLAWHENQPRRADISPDDLLLDPSWVEGLRVVGSRELVFELQVWPTQLERAGRVVAGVENLTIVLDHAGLPRARDGGQLGQWKRALEFFAAEVPTSMLKLSALDAMAPGWTKAEVLPVLDQAIQIFGPARCMFGSNFPVDKIHATYASIWSAFHESVAQYSEPERWAMLVGNASRTYRIEKGTP